MPICHYPYSSNYPTVHHFNKEIHFSYYSLPHSFMLSILKRKIEYNKIIKKKGIPLCSFIKKMFLNNYRLYE